MNTTSPAIEWHTLLQNPQAVTAIYNKTPNLEATKLIQVRLNSGGAAEVCFCFQSIPDRRPRKWAKETNYVSVELRIERMVEFELKDWFPRDQMAPLTLEREPRGIRIRWQSQGYSLTALAESVALTKINGYLRAKP
jgi:hypothetical protein